MARTYRNRNPSGRYGKAVLRRPKTLNEKRALTGLDDNYSLRNREKARVNNIPDHWDDIVQSAYYETDWNDD
ncbi:hypothetical protein SCRM01_241 [Synechococcus phage S-CRM01]|uniref:hypothetical protein n=1 Tax=Synechococcus phage S-CRM01 TaxID=1026955 RepID=UPI000209E442|nr:hypothetical protein SCRM01_241 [Synechococcus phage S-CRM01]AEC53187.1 hypothetical protein SCRM01_241 [Synechococcus phage S-CRM01]